MRRRFFNSRINNNFIIYTSSDNLIVIPFRYDFGATIISNAINNNVGKITFNSDVTIIGNAAFSGCYSLTSIEIPNSVTSIGEGAFYYCSSLTSIEIPYSVTSIGDDVFFGCESLTSIEIPNSVTSIGDEAFRGCKSLTSIEIPNSITSIGDWAFAYCSGLSSIVISNSVTSIGDGAFKGCSSLTSVYVKATTPPTLGGNAFVDNAPNRKIYVPRASLNAYKTAEGWSEYASAIEPYDFDGSVNEITFYIDDGMYVTPMKALSNMTYGEFVNSEYANQNSMLTDFRLKDYGAYNGILFYHEEAMFDMTLYVDNSVHNNVHDYDVIEDGKTYYAY